MTTSLDLPKVSKRAFNFNAGPGALPFSVLERIREELLDWRGSGMSVMEMSHRSPEFESINADAEARLRKLLAIPEDYAVIFLQGGGSTQFTMAPMNLCLPGKPVDVLHTGMWTTKAIGELKKGVLHNIAASTEPEKFARLPRQNEMKFSSDPCYVHICTNNTIEGTQWKSLPDVGNAPLVADMSSDIASRPIDVKKFGLIFAGAQKNLGPSGVTIVIVRKDLAERADKNLPTLLQYRTHIKEKSLYHTPPTFAIYVVGLVLEWIESEGGIPAITTRNDAKAKLLYDTIESRRRILFLPRGMRVALQNERSVPCSRRRRIRRKTIRQGSRGSRPGGHPRSPLSRRHARLALQRCHPRSRAGANHLHARIPSHPRLTRTVRH